MQARELIYLYSAVPSNAVGDPAVAGRDEFGDPIAGAAPETATTVAAGVPPDYREALFAVVFPRQSSETVTATSDTVTVGLSALLPAKTVIDAADRAYARGQMWSVEGVPADYLRKGIIVALSRAQGG